MKLFASNLTDRLNNQNLKNYLKLSTGTASYIHVSDGMEQSCNKYQQQVSQLLQRDRDTKWVSYGEKALSTTPLTCMID